MTDHTALSLATEVLDSSHILQADNGEPRRVFTHDSASDMMWEIHGAFDQGLPDDSLYSIAYEALCWVHDCEGVPQARLSGEEWADNCVSVLTRDRLAWLSDPWRASLAEECQREFGFDRSTVAEMAALGMYEEYRRVLHTVCDWLEENAEECDED